MATPDHVADLMRFDQRLGGAYSFVTDSFGPATQDVARRLGGASADPKAAELLAFAALAAAISLVSNVAHLHEQQPVPNDATVLAFTKIGAEVPPGWEDMAERVTARINGSHDIPPPEDTPEFRKGALALLRRAITTAVVPNLASGPVGANTDAAADKMAYETQAGAVTAAIDAELAV